MAIMMIFYSNGFSLDGFTGKYRTLFGLFTIMWGHAVAQWLRHCATNRKVAGLIPDSVVEIFN
jgi:hypothetical protein